MSRSLFSRVCADLADPTQVNAPLAADMRLEQQGSDSAHDTHHQARVERSSAASGDRSRNQRSRVAAFTANGRSGNTSG